MKCENCGSDNNDDAKFCKKCGNSLTQPVEAETKKKGFSPVIIALLVIVCLVLALGCAYAYVVYYDVSHSEILQLTGSNHGNVLKNSEIASNIPDSEVSDEIVEAAKSGVPIYKIGDGDGPVTVISAGVHGNQLVPSVAAMKLVNYLEGRKIKGTVYVIPFVSPKAISANSELTDGVNLNQVADDPGTVSNAVVEFAKSNGATALGDFHETQVGRDPGFTTIMCSEYPTYGSFQLANSMSGLSLDTTLTYTIAGIAYDGAIEDECNLAGLPAVTPLVVVPSHGKVYDGAVTESYNQMLALLIVNGNLDYDDFYLRIANSDIDGF